MSIADRISGFMQVRDHNADTQTWNLLNTSLGGWLRYRTFLSVIRDRYVEASEIHTHAWQLLHESIERGSTVGERQSFPQDQQEEYDRITQHSLRIHLEIESFYVFANILLDRIAWVCQFYFSRKAKWNHWQLTANFENFCKKKNLAVPSADLLKMPLQLQALIVKYRNERIVHVEEPRLTFGTTWSPVSRVKIIPLVLYPEPGEVEKIQHSTADLDELLALLNAYMTTMLDFFDANADKSILTPQQT